jgi:spoIIIJ-associated protein
MSFYEFTGKSVKEAIARACDELNTQEALLEIEVMEESTRGFLGLVGQRDARVRVKKRDILKEVMEAEPAPEVRLEPSADAEDAFEGNDEPAEAELEEDNGGGEKLEKLAPENFIDQAAAVLERIIKLIPVEAEIEPSVKEGSVYLDIKGDGSGLLIGKKGQTLDALQYLVSKIVNKENLPGKKVEIVVDTENYRLRKQENLREIALKMSQKAKRTLKPVSFNPMPPHERRMIHMILAEDREVYTKSYGEGPMRRIIVYPRRGSANKRRRR